MWQIPGGGGRCQRPSAAPVPQIAVDGKALMVDAGANHGTYALLAAPRGHPPSLSLRRPVGWIFLKAGGATSGGRGQSSCPEGGGGTLSPGGRRAVPRAEGCRLADSLSRKLVMWKCGTQIPHEPAGRRAVPRARGTVHFRVCKATRGEGGGSLLPPSLYREVP